LAAIPRPDSGFFHVEHHIAQAPCESSIPAVSIFSIKSVFGWNRLKSSPTQLHILPALCIIRNAATVLLGQTGTYPHLIAT